MRTLTDYELAMLAGGPARVEETALAGLVARGAVRISRSGEITPTESGPGAADPIQSHVLYMIGDRHRLGTTFGFARSPHATVLAAPLVAAGLLVPPGRWEWVRTARVFAAPLLLVLLIVAMGASAAAVVFALLLTIGLWVLSTVILSRLGARTTRRGEALLVEARAERPRTGPDVALIAAGGLAVIGLYGLLAYPDPELAHVFGEFPLVSAGAAGGSGSGSGGGADGSWNWTDGDSTNSGGDGGGGDGGGDGGGCGGCGGCGG